MTNSSRNEIQFELPNDTLNNEYLQQEQQPFRSRPIRRKTFKSLELPNIDTDLNEEN